jgi:hypothetical protein
MKNIILIVSTFFVGSNFFISPFNTTSKHPVDSRLEYLVGEWKSEGFVTDTNNMQQKIEIAQHIGLKDNRLVFTANGINATSRYHYNSTKAVFINDNKKSVLWVQGQVADLYTLNQKAYINQDSTLSFTFYDEKGTLTRYFINKENNNSFVETEERWTEEGWEKTACLKTQRQIIE